MALAAGLVTTRELPAPVSSDHAEAASKPDRLGITLAGLVLALLLFGLVAGSHTRVTMPFGDSHDGRNAGVWGGQSRSLRQEGPIATALGTRAVVGGVVTPYANHPPLIAAEVAAAEAVLGERPWVTRLPAWGGSLAALVLAFLLLRACELRPLAAAAGVAVGFGCPMFATYGTMLDTPIVGLPFGIAVLLLWQRGRQGRPARPAVVALVSVLAALTSWLGLLTAVLVAIATAVPAVRRRRAPASGNGVDLALPGPPVAGAVAGAAAGALLTVSWIAWAYGSLRPLGDQLLFRTGQGGEAIGPATFVTRLQDYWTQVFTPWQLLLAIPVLVAAVRWRPARAVATVALLDLAVWVVGFRDGAAHHDYWAYWMVVPLALGIGVAAEAGLRAVDQYVRAGRWSSRRRSVGLSGLALLSGGLALVGVLAPSGPGRAQEEGAPGGAAVRSAAYPPGQRTAWYLGDVVGPTSWIAYASHRPAVELRNLREVNRVAAEAPDDLVLVDAVRLRPDARSPGPDPGCLAGLPAGEGYAVVPAAALAASLDRPPSVCPG